MRKCAAIACAVLMAVSACACKKEAPAPITKTSIPRVSTTTTAVPTVTLPEDPEKEPLNLTFATSFSDGVAFVRYLDGDGVEHAAAIDTEGNLLFELPEEMPFEGAGYQGGVRVVNHVMYDKTGAVIASPELSGYDELLTGNCGGYVVAKKIETMVLPTPETSLPTITTTTASTDTTDTAETTDATDTTDSTTATETTETTTATDTTDTTTGTTPVPIDPPVINLDTVSIGVLNTKGEWVYPLSADHPIAALMASAVQTTVALEYLPAGVLQVRVDAVGAAQYYHFADNVLTPSYSQYASFYTTENEVAGIYQMAADGSKKLVMEGLFGDYFFSDVFIGREVIPATVFGDPESLGATKMYDYTGKELADLSGYTLGGVTACPFGYYVGEHLVLPVLDELGGRLLVVINKEGKLVYESPIVLGRGNLFAPDSTGFVVESYTLEGDAQYCHYDYEGNVTAYPDVTSFAGFCDGLAVVTLRGDTERYYYMNYSGEIVLR